MKLYKATDKNMKCRGYQYQMGKEETCNKAELCNTGFHACEYPLDVFIYYSPADSRFFEVELDEVSDESAGVDTKRVGEKIKFVSELDIKGLTKAAINYTFANADWTNDNSAQATGYRSASQATGEYSASQATGDFSASQATGYRSASQATGDNSAAQATGHQSASQATGDFSASQATGYRSASQATGNQALASVNGNFSSASVSGVGAVACALGYNCKARGTIGSWLVIAERGEWNGEAYSIKTLKAVRVDGEKIKADTDYILVGGVFKEATK